MKTISFDQQKLKEFKRLYNKAVKEGKDSFIFIGDEYLTTYAKYVIEYLTNQFKSDRRN